MRTIPLPLPIGKLLSSWCFWKLACLSYRILDKS